MARLRSSRPPPAGGWPAHRYPPAEPCAPAQLWRCPARRGENCRGGVNPASQWPVDIRGGVYWSPWHLRREVEGQYDNVWACTTGIPYVAERPHRGDPYGERCRPVAGSRGRGWHALPLEPSLAKWCLWLASVNCAPVRRPRL